MGRSVPRLYAYLEIKTTGPHNFRGCNGYPDMIVRVMILLQGQRIMCAIHNPIAKTVNFGDGTIGTEQRGYKVVVYRAVPKIFVMKPLI